MSRYVKFITALTLAATAFSSCGKASESSESSKPAPEIVASKEQLTTSSTQITTETVTETSTEGDTEQHIKPFIDKNTDIDLSKIKIGDVDYDFGTMTVGELLDATGTRELGYYTVSVQYEDEFYSTAYGYGRLAEMDGVFTDEPVYGSIFALETKIGDEWNAKLTKENRNSAEIKTFVACEIKDDFGITFADGRLNFKEDMPLADVEAAIGKGTNIVGDHNFIGYCDGDTMLVLDLDMFDDVVEKIYVYQTD